MTDQDLNSDELEVAPLENVDNESMQSQETQIDVEAQRREEAKERDFRALSQKMRMKIMFLLDASKVLHVKPWHL